MSFNKLFENKISTITKSINDLTDGLRNEVHSVVTIPLNTGVLPVISGVLPAINGVLPKVLPSLEVFPKVTGTVEHEVNAKGNIEPDHNQIKLGLGAHLRL